jgi:aspartyl aminopeptidase
MKAGGKYFTTRNQTALMAWIVPESFTLGQHGITAVAAHTDSPQLRLKPKSAQKSAGYLTVGVQTYGGGLWHTWFDRDLTVAGRVIVEREGTHTAHLVHVPRPILRIPSLAIHLDRGVSDAFKFNNEEQLVPVLASVVRAALDASDEQCDPRHHPLLVRVLAESLHCAPEQIREFELCLCDAQPAVIGGALNEFIFSAQLDNLMCSYMAVQALIRAEAEADANLKLVRTRARDWSKHVTVPSNLTQRAGVPVRQRGVRQRVRAGGQQQHDAAADRAHRAQSQPAPRGQSRTDAHHAAQVLLHLRGHGARDPPECTYLPLTTPPLTL